ncbi:MAG: hypothetical protein ACW99G_23365 [Candidatus Thorarchaeota archaeon]
MELEGKLEEAQELQAATAKTWFCEGVMRCISILKENSTWMACNLDEKFRELLTLEPETLDDIRKFSFTKGVEACMDIVERNVSPGEKRGHLKGLMAIIKYEDYN